MAVFTPTRTNTIARTPTQERATPRWWFSKKHSSRFSSLISVRGSQQQYRHSPSTESQPCEKKTPPVEELDESTATTQVGTPLPSLPTPKLVNPYSRSHCLDASKWMLSELLFRTKTGRVLPHIGTTSLTAATLRRFRQLTAAERHDMKSSKQCQDLFLHQWKCSQDTVPSSPLRIRCQSVIGRGAVSLVMRTHTDSSEHSLVVKLQITEFHLSLREMYIALAYQTRHRERAHSYDNCVSWIMPANLIYATLTSQQSNEGIVTYGIPKADVSELLGVGYSSLETFVSINWCSKKRRAVDHTKRLSASLLLLPTPHVPCWTLLDLSNGIHHSTRELRREMKNLATEDVYLYMAYQLMTLMEMFHDVGLIHGDVKPDNFLVYRGAENTPLRISGIDYGRSLDVRGLYGNQCWFAGSCHAKGFQTPEMLMEAPWSFGIDHYGVACTMHVLIAGRYLDIADNKRVSPLSPEFRRTLLIDMCVDALPVRRFIHHAFWRSFFSKLLTFDDCLHRDNDRQECSVALCCELRQDILLLLSSGSTSAELDNPALMDKLRHIATIISGDKIKP